MFLANEKQIYTTISVALIKLKLNWSRISYSDDVIMRSYSDDVIMRMIHLVYGFLDTV